MNLEAATIKDACPRQEIAAYLDGELNHCDEMSLEGHLANCPACASELNEQKKMLCFLDGALLDKDEIEVPANFTKIVVANAQGKVSGLRQPQERLKALFICACLFFFVLLGLGNETQTVVKTFINFSEQILAVSGFIWHFVYDLAFGTAIILRSVSSQLLFNSGASMVFQIILLLALLASFSRLIIRFNRA